MSSESISVSNSQPSRRASTPLPPKPPPPPPMNQHSATDRPEVSTSSTNNAALASIHETTASNSSPPLALQRKPSPAPKPSRLSRALSSGYMTLPSFWRNHKRSKSAKENEKIKELGKVNGKEKRRKEDSQEVDTAEDKTGDKSHSTATTSNAANGPELRDTPLWKLPGLDITRRRHSATSFDKEGSPKPPSKSTTQEVSELPDTLTHFPEHPYQEELPLKPITATTRELPDIPSEFPEHQPSPRPNAAAASTRELPELPATPEPHPRPVTATTRELPELPIVLPQLPERHSPAAGAAAVATTRELPALPNQLPTESFPVPIPVTPLSESPPMEESPPPELPPRPEAPLTSLGTAASHVAVATDQNALPASLTVPTSELENDSQSGAGKSCSLREFVQKHSKSFPIRIRVLQGYCSEDSEFNISTDDMYNIHFIKHTKVVTIRDEDGVTYSLPMGSAMKFGLIYNPNNNLDEALSGYNFEKVSDVMAMPMLPKIIRTTKGVQSSEDKWALEEGEILVTRHIHKPVFKGRKGLKVFSLLTKSDKVLPEDCTGHFSTKPSLVQLHLPEIIQHIPNPFPSLAVMYSTSGSTMQLHNPGTQSRVITMCESSCETSLVASPAVQEGQEGENSQTLFDIPLNDDISDMEVEVIQTQDEEESEHLYDDTLTIFEKFDPTKLQPLKTISSTPPSKTQSLFLHSVRRGYEKVGVNIEPPYVNIQRARWLPAKDEAEKDVDDQSNGYATVGFKLSNRWHSYEDEDNESAAYDHVGYDKPDQGDPKLTSWVQDLHTASQALESRLSLLEGGQPSVEIGRMQLMLEQLTHKLESVDTQLQLMATPQRPPSPQAVMQGSSQSTEESNRNYLSSLDEDQILNLLEAMDLGRYCEGFQREHITGEILAECNEEVLQHELGMASKIHRIRLMKIISGQHTARSFLRT